LAGHRLFPLGADSVGLETGVWGGVPGRCFRGAFGSGWPETGVWGRCAGEALPTAVGYGWPETRVGGRDGAVRGTRFR
jgi:hypothetical protein